jgi:hypothetical protein
MRRSRTSRIASRALPEKPEFREIALRLPKLQAELRELRERRSQLEQP